MDMVVVVCTGWEVVDLGVWVVVEEGILVE